MVVLGLEEFLAPGLEARLVIEAHHNEGIVGCEQIGYLKNVRLPQTVRQIVAVRNIAPLEEGAHDPEDMEGKSWSKKGTQAGGNSCTQATVRDGFVGDGKDNVQEEDGDVNHLDRNIIHE